VVLPASPATDSGATAETPTKGEKAGKSAKGVALASVAPVPSAPVQAPAEYIGWTKPLPAYVIPTTPIPAGLSWTKPAGDATRGQQLYSMSSCIGCHAIRGNPMSIGNVGPDLTHVASRHTIAGGLFPNDDEHLALWIKNARKMKPGSIMPTLGKGEWDPIMKTKADAGALDDQQLADIVAYLRSLK
jgi:cytochrome c oxidase subunit 2